MNMKEPEVLSVKKRLASEICWLCAIKESLHIRDTLGLHSPPMICTYTIVVRVNRQNMGKYHMSYKGLPIVFIIIQISCGTKH